MRQKMTSLLIIDPQYDFYDVPLNEQLILDSKQNTISPSLPVPNSWEDAKMLAAFINKQQDHINNIVVTLDSHHEYDIAHSIYWQNKLGEHPTPFTLISHQDIIDGIWQPTKIEQLSHVLKYTQSLEKSGKYNLIIWPTHCVIGSVGHCIVSPIHAAITAWEMHKATQHHVISKGENPHTEHYGGCEAEYPLRDDIKTQFDPQLIELVKSSDQVFISGQALSHCIASTVEQIVKKLSSDDINKLTILIDTTSPVAGFEQQAKTFTENMANLGVNVTKTAEVTMD
ncbi:hypothetical protein UA38_01850 [Photobacterium kishitanii]|uniref:Nicotinamidase n=1 Tax=Photobacterium kishitanii TaxID=318456 RepID=A0AAX0Z1C3_9GAMM|nr:hypothetical protein [Photobacterium kishitanii]KJG10905.1 hypothetical protein UB40_06125 [Photobacterium kishitanii]KJG59911.1 hypothetical protein UA38_01850 [Photobacterium kishitanii]KJG63193.1 hypothetical protein UA42_02235 [Photobacterium kishitanii]KJG67797.1 hypothetical protein UA40_00610 [Photobacterium kishitanii]KJG71365.1 hypothetical protein UA41_01865 [Photobacterium kishitanii]